VASALSEIAQKNGASTWKPLLLEVPTPVSVFIYTALAVVLVAATEWALVRRARRTSSEP